VFDWTESSSVLKVFPMEEVELASTAGSVEVESTNLLSGCDHAAKKESLASRAKTLVVGPKGHRSTRLIVVAVFLLLAITVLDGVMTYLDGFVKFEIGSVNVDLGSTTSDLTVSVSSRASLMSRLHAAGLSQSSSQVCQIQTKNGVGHIHPFTFVSINSSSVLRPESIVGRNAMGSMDVTVDLTDLNYHTVRKLAKHPQHLDELLVNCKINAVFYAYSAFPIYLPTYTLSQSISISNLRNESNSMSFGKRGMSNSLFDFLSALSTSISPSQAVISLTNYTLKLPKKMVSSFPLTVSIPALQLSFGAVTDPSFSSGSINSSVLNGDMMIAYNLSMPAMDLVLSSRYLTLNTNLSLTCSNPYSSSCSLFTPGKRVFDGLKTDHSTLGIIVGNGTKNFISSFIGQQHVVNIDSEHVPSFPRLADAFPQSSESSSTAVRRLDDSYTNGTCTTVTVDGSPTSSSCYSTNNAYFDNYFYINTPSGNLVTLVTVISWTHSAELVITATSELSYYYEQYFGRYDFVFNETSSFLGFDFFVKDFDTEVIFSDLNATWGYNRGASGLDDYFYDSNMSPAVAHGDAPFFPYPNHYVEGEGVNLVRYYGDVVAVTEAEFFAGGDDTDGFLSFLAIDNATATGPTDLTTGFNFLWNVSNAQNWKVELTDFEFSLYENEYFNIDSLWELAVPPDDESGLFGMRTTNSPDGVEEYLNENFLQWDFTNEFNNGQVTFLSETLTTMRNTTATHMFTNFVYGDNKYAFSTQDYVNVSDSHASFVADAVGTYGGDQYDWYFTVQQSDVVVDGDQVAAVTGDIYYVVPSGGMTGSITTQALDIVDHKMEFKGDAELKWNLQDGGNEGEINAHSKALLSSGYVYNVTGEFDYGNNQYSLDVTDNINDFLADANGRYGGNQYHW
jgi:hypothetical protein